MFNSNLKKEALKIHEKTLERYNLSYEKMTEACEALYSVRINSVDLIKYIQAVVNSIANTPKEYDTEFGKIGKELEAFHETKEYAERAYNESLKAGAGIAGGAFAGMGIASMAPTAMMSVATTFGTATTGTAISALSGAAAQKAAVAWIGRTFAGFAVKEGAGLAVGNAFLALAGPIGWGVTAASTGLSLVSLTKKNKEISDDAVREAKDIAKARESLDETTDKILALKAKTGILYNDMNSQKNKIMSYINRDYLTFEDSDKEYLGSIVNNTLSLSVLLNETIC